MKKYRILMSTVLLIAGCVAPKDQPAPLRTVAQSENSMSVGQIGTALLTWPRASADKFGCFLENQFGAKDKKFNCLLKDYQNTGDVCKDVKAYYEGPKFPGPAAEKMNPAIKDIHLQWEHGALQEVKITLAKKESPETARLELGLPPQNAPLPSNVMSINVHDCYKTTTCVVIEGFERQGSGDADCSGK